MPRCPHCGSPSQIRQLYDEIANDTATWTDAVFWMLIGMMLTFVGYVVYMRWPA